MKRLWNWIPNLWSNPVSAFGTVLTTVTAFTLLFLLGTDIGGPGGNTYAAALMLIALPTLFVFGLLLIPFGLFLYRKRRRVQGQRPLAESVAALFTTPRGWRKLAILGMLTVVNVVLLGAATHRAVEWMDSPGFCGTACHTVMQPEYESYKDSAHARVACIECHIGPGASYLVRSKLDGLRQVWRTVTDTYTRPVPTPVHTLRPSRDTCEKCHWPDQFHGNRLVHRVHTTADEANTQTSTVLSLKVGGRDKATGAYHGIHWHVSRDTEVRYEALDAKRETIGKVTVLKDGQVVREFLPPAGTTGAPVETRTMDCIDCHNRPTHVFDHNPAGALERGFATGLLDAGTPWLFEVADSVLQKTESSRDGAEAALRRSLEAAYRERRADAMPDTAKLDAAAKGLSRLWLHNVFPERAVTWGTYVSHIGHPRVDAAGPGPEPVRFGCFRCHDDKHATADGKKLTGDCATCHDLLSQDEKVDDLEEGIRALIAEPPTR